MGLLVLDNFLQRYQVSLCEEDIPRAEVLLAGGDGFIRAPGQHKLIFKPRE